MSDKNLALGVGVYTVGQAARLASVTTRQIRHWMLGYRQVSKTSYVEMPSIWKPDLPQINSTLELTFQDLLEVKFIDTFRKFGVSWKSLRRAAQRATELYNTPHPFSTRRFKTDGRSVFAELGNATGDKKLIDLGRSQYAFQQILAPYLYASLDFDNDVASRWWPLKRHTIVIDPARQFGQPIVATEGVPTATLFRAYKANGTFKKVSQWFEVDVKSVKDAVAFEQRMANRKLSA
jgi:uncharacterized protein (DUF433 family)